MNQVLNNLTTKLQRLAQPDLNNTRHRLFTLSNAEDLAELNNLLESQTGLEHHNEILSQCQELVKIDNPTRKFTDLELVEEGRSFLEQQGGDSYGNYVYYPWSKRLIRILPKKDFIRLRTSRNKLKITEEEQAKLASKKIGVIGLSVGQSVAVTMATERIFGTLRIADFDTLELSNLNRIRKGLDYLGAAKTTMVIREIAEIDPYLKVEVFEEGITPQNIDAFLGEGQGQLDLLIEECDSFPIKIMARMKAKQKRLAVLMDTSDRGMIDIERFDLEPERSIFHDLVPGLEHMDLMQLTEQERLNIMMGIVDYPNVSERMKTSYASIGKTLTTWPQLASSVVLGGAAICDIARKVLLGEQVSSGRFYVDLDQIIK
jgi:molybdopterin/thiamine biosynthesis adenylyltransferase